MKTIRISKDYTTSVSDEDYEYLSQFNWSLDTNKRKDGSGEVIGRYAQRSTKTEKGYPSISMHREIMKPPKGMLVDHIDGDGLNNQRENLRICNKSQNQTNGNSRKGSSSKYKNVYFIKREKRWMVCIKDKGKLKYVGSFKTELEAGIIANIMIRKYHGEFARPNNLTKITY